MLSDWKIQFIHHSALFLHPSNSEQVSLANSYFMGLLNSSTTPGYLLDLLHEEHSPEALEMGCRVLIQVVSYKWSYLDNNLKQSLLALLKHIVVDRQETSLYAYESMLLLLARLMRNSWNDASEFRNLYKFAEELLAQDSTLSKLKGVKLLNLITQEMQKNVDKPLLQHPRNSENFKKETLPILFSLSFDHLSLQILNPSDPELLRHSLKLMCTILSFDALEDSDEFIVNLPSDLPQSASIRNPIFVHQLFQLYESLISSRYHDGAKLCLELLSLMVSINLHHFILDIEKLSFLTEIVKGGKIILDSQFGLNDEECRHDFTMLISRIGTSNAIYELREFSDIGKFISKVYEYSISCIQLQDFNLLHYILKFWLKMSFKLSYFSDMKDSLVSYIRSVSEMVICMLVQEEQSENIQSILDLLWGLIKADYLNIGNACIDQFKIGVQKVMGGEGSIYSVSAMILIFNTFMIENKKIYSRMPVPNLASQGMPSSTEVSSEEQILNANITSLIIQLQSILLTNSHLSNENLQISCLIFLKSFVAKYFKLNVGNHIKTSYSYISSSLGLEGEQDLLREIIKILFSYINSSNREEIHSICGEILSSLVAGCRKIKVDNQWRIECGKLEFKSEYIQEILHRYANREFLCQNIEFRIKPRIKLISGIMGLYFISADCIQMNFESMMGPVKQSIQNLSKWEDYKHLICLVYDLTGILQAINSATIYSDFFDFYFTYSSALSELFFKFYTDKSLCIPILKLLQELCLNRKNRILFGSHCNISSAPNGVILFKYIQSSIFNLLSRYPEITSSDLDTVYHYKVLSNAIKAYAHALTGNFANISLLKLYSDDSGQKTIESVFFYMLNIPIEEILCSIQKFYHFFYFVEYLTRDDFLVEYLFGLPSEMTRKLLRLLADGVQSYDSKLTLICYNIVYNIMRLLCTVKPKMTPAFLKFRSEQDDGLKLLLKVFLGLILQGECGNITDISRTLLALINLQQGYFKIAVSEICTSFQETKSNFIKSSLEECWKGMNFDWCQIQNVETQEKLERNLYWEKAFKKRIERFVKLINSN